MFTSYQFVRNTFALLILSFWAAPAIASVARIDSLNNLSRGYIFSNIEKSVRLYGDLAEEARSLDYREGQARALQRQGVALYLNARYEDGVNVSLQAIRIFEELNMQHELALTFGDLGYQMKRRDLTRATRFMRQGISIAESGTDSVALCTLYDNFGVLHEMDAQPDSAAYYYQLALAFKTALNDSLGIPFSLNNLSGIAAMQGEMDLALELLARSDDYRQAMADSFGLIENSIQLSELYFKQGDLPAAAEQFEKSLTMSGMIEYGYMVAHCYERLAAIYAQTRDFEKAYQNHLAFTAYNDSLSNIDTNSRMASLELEFDTERKDRLLAESELAIASRSRQLLILAAIVVLLIVAGLGVMRLEQLKRVRLRREMEWNERLGQIEYEQKMADEKLRISRELHDNIGAQLTFITSSIDNVAHQSELSEARIGLEAISEFGRGTLGELRHTVWAMRSEGEGIAALVNKFRELKQQCSRAGRHLEFESHCDDDTPTHLSSGRMLNVYRIAQEAVQNALKHTDDGIIRLVLSLSHSGLVLSIKDEGAGFVEQTTNHVGGISNMRARCEEIGGTFELKTGAGGTEIYCRLPAE